MRLFITFIPLILPVLADDHKQCDCKINDGYGWQYDWQLTYNACTSSYSHTAEYDHGSGRCIAIPNTRLDGDRWYTNCANMAAKGYLPVVNDATDTTQEPIRGKTGGSNCYD